MTAELLIEVRGHIAILTLNRPHVHNAFDHAMSAQMAAAMDDIDADPAIRVCILQGAAGTFSSGTDLGAYAAGESTTIDPRGLYGFLEHGPNVPVIAAVEGYAVGGGFELVLGCDLIIAAGGGRFGLPEVTHGVFPSGGAHRLPLRIPHHLAMEYALTGRWLSAERAYELNLVNRLTDPGEALGAALDLADEIAGHAPLAVQATTAAIRDAGYHDSQEAAWASQRQRLQHVARSQDSREGIAAFLDKRAPQWRGG